MTSRRRSRPAPPARRASAQSIVFDVIKQVTGQANVIAFMPLYVDLVGDIKTALMLGQIIYWSDRGTDPGGWFYKANDEWWSEIRLTEKESRTALAHLKKFLWLDTKVKRIGNGETRVHIRLDRDRFINDLVRFVGGDEAAAVLAGMPCGTVPSAPWGIPELPQGADDGMPPGADDSYIDYHIQQPGAESNDSQGAGDLWRTALGQLEMQMTRATFDTWLKHSQGLALEDGTFVVGVASERDIDWLRNRLHATIKRTLADMLGHAIEVRYVVNSKQGG